MRLHHLCIVVENVEEYSGFLTKYFNLQKKSDIVYDCIQQVNIQLVGDDRDFILEIIQPVSDHSTVKKFLDKGGGFYHLCYEVDDIEKSIADLSEKGAIVVKGPDPAVVFNNQKVVFLLIRKVGIVELLEKS